MDIQVSRSFETCHIAPKVYQLDAEISLKLTCAVVSLFNASVNVTTEKMTGIDIYESALMFCEQYTHESISDLMHCLKLVKLGQLGVVYNRFDTATLFQFFQKYLDLKYAKYESATKTTKSNTDGSVNTEFHTEVIFRERLQENKKNDTKWKEAVRVQEVIELKREFQLQKAL